MMRTILSLTVLLVLLSPCRAQGSKPAEPALSNTRRAECVLEISRQSDFNQDDILLRPAQNEQLTSKLLGVDDRWLMALVEVKDMTQTMDGLRLKLVVDLDHPVWKRARVGIFGADSQGPNPPMIEDIRPAAQEMLDALVELIQEHYQQMYARQVGAINHGLDVLSGVQDKQQNDIRQLSEQLRTLTSDNPQSAMPPQDLHRIVLDLDAQQRQLRIDQVSSESRRDAITAAIERLRMQSDQSVENDPVLTELKKVESLRSEALKRSRKLLEAGPTGQDDVNEAEKALAEVRARMAERRQTARRQAGGELIDELNRELVMLGIADAEQQAKLDFVSRQLDKYQQGQDVADQYIVLNQRLDLARQAYLTSDAEEQQLRTRIIRADRDRTWVKVTDQHAE